MSSANYLALPNELWLQIDDMNRAADAIEWQEEAVRSLAPICASIRFIAKNHGNMMNYFEECDLMDLKYIYLSTESDDYCGKLQCDDEMLDQMREDLEATARGESPYFWLEPDWIEKLKTY